MIVIVCGQTRKAGKTRAVCDIISATRGAHWTAVKVSPHPHDPHPSGGDTRRYLEAGAAAAYLIDTPADIPQATNLIIESNSAASLIRPDLLVFVADPDQPDWKDSARRLLDRADIVVQRRINEDVLRRVRQGLSESQLSAQQGSVPHPPE